MWLAAVGAQAQGALPVVTTAEEQAAWPMVGRVNIRGVGSRQMCTGTLIAADQVLTAAHCLDLPPGRSVEDVVFVAGWRQSSWVADAAGAQIEQHPDWDSTAPPSIQTIAVDIGVLHLAEPLDIAPLPLAALPEFPPLLDIRAYRADRPHALSRQTTCRITGQQTTILQTDCPVVPGSSGGPLLWNSPDGWRLVAILSATTATHSFAVTVTDWPGIE